MTFLRCLAWCNALSCTCTVGCSSSPTSFFTASSYAGSPVVVASGGAGGAGGVGSSSLGGSFGAGLAGAAGAGGSQSVPSELSAGGAAGAAGTVVAGDAGGTAIAGGAATGAVGQAGSDAGAPSRNNDGDRCAPECCKAADDAKDVAAIVLADSVLGFSGTQGRCGWSFGYLPLGAEPFTRLAVYSGTEGQTPAWSASSVSHRWLTITSTEQHPNGIPLAWVDRRWTSDISGRVVIRGHVAKVDAAITGDGIRALVQVGGKTLWQASLAFNDTHGSDFSLQADVEVGTPVDFIVAPGLTDAHDTTAFTAVISR